MRERHSLTLSAILPPEVTEVWSLGRAAFVPVDAVDRITLRRGPRKYILENRAAFIVSQFTEDQNLS